MVNKKIRYQYYNPKFKEARFPDENWSYIAPTWEEMHQISLDLGVKILEENKKYDTLVTLIKGGWTWSRTMVDILDIPELASFRLRLYDPKYPGIKLSKPILEVPLTHSLEKKKILLFDDTDETGESLEFAKNYLKEFHPASVTTSTLFHKPHSKIKPEFYGSVTSSWIIFPHERREAISGLAGKWSEKGIKENEIKKRLLEIGLPEKEINLFINLKYLNEQDSK